MVLTGIKRVEESEAQVTTINSTCYSLARMWHTKVSGEVRAWQ
jgi:hypothetical protein